MSDETFVLFSDPDSRFIFRFSDGTKNHALDPFDIEEKLDAALQDESPSNRMTKLDRLRSEYFEGATRGVRRDALKKLAEIARQVFDLQPFDPATETGVTIHEAFTILSFFLAMQENVKKNLEETRFSPPSTDSSPEPDL